MECGTALLGETLCATQPGKELGRQEEHSMPTYTLSRDNLGDIKRGFAKVVPLILLIAIGPLSIAFAYSSEIQYMFFFVLTVLVATVAIAFVLILVRRAKTSYTIENGKVISHLPGYADITIERDDIQRILEDPATGMTIHYGSSNQSIHIPPELTDYQLVRAELNLWKAIEPDKPARSRLLVVMISLIAVSGFAAIGAFVFKIKVFFFVFALTFLSIMILGMYASSKEEPKPKKSASPANLVILILILLYFLYEIIKSLIK